MSATILVHLDGEPGALQRVELAAGLARRTDALLIGSAAGAPVAQPRFAPAGAWIPGLVAQEEEMRRVLQDLHDRFLAAAGPMAGGWRAGILEPTLFLASQARAADLLVVGASQSNPACSPLAADAGRLVVSAGRPVLVVPPGLADCDFGCAVVAWKDTREARRALIDGLPLLRLTKRVVVVHVALEPDQAGLADVVGQLGRHGCPAEALTIRDSDDAVPALLMDTARDEGAGLIVSGAYGRSRQREWLLGGVTRELLTSSPVCCLMSH